MIDGAAFLHHILPAQGPYVLHVVPANGKRFNEFAPTIDALWQAEQRHDAAGATVYHALAAFIEARRNAKGEKSFGRTKANVRELRCLWLDVDCGTGKPYADASAGAQALLGFLTATGLPEPTVVASGLGMHVYWPLAVPLPPDDWQPYADGLKRLCAQHGFAVDSGSVGNSAAMLRTPGTTHRKGTPRPVRCARLTGPWPIERFVNLHGLAGLPRKGRHPQARRGGAKLAERINRNLHTPTYLAAIAQHCGHIAQMRDTRGAMIEPWWFDCLGVAAFCKDGPELAHAWSQGHPKYSFEETEEKLARKRELDGPTHCTTLAKHNSEICAKCPFSGQITQPTQLGYIANLQQPLVEAPQAVAEPVEKAVLSTSPEANGHVNGVATAPPSIFGQVPIVFRDFDDKGRPKGTCTNARIAIQGLGIDCRHDVFHEKLIVGGQPIEQWAGEISDHAVLALRVLIKDQFGFDPGTDNTANATVQLCIRRRFDPVVDWLDALIWDGRERLGGWLTTHLGAQASPWHQAVGALMLIAAVRRARAPGTKFDQIIVWEGPEGTGKSSAVRILAGADCFSDQHILGASDREVQEAIQGVWLYEIAELAGMRRADVERVKNFCSRTEDRARPAYGRFRVDRPRRCIFIATTNEESYLKSETGNRRFWPIKTGREIDLAALQRDRDQLWAEAAMWEAKGVDISLPVHLRGHAQEAQEERLDTDPWQSLIWDHLQTKNIDDTTSEDLLKDVLHLHMREVDQIAKNRMARILRRLGFERYRKRRGPDLQWRYRIEAQPENTGH